MRLKDAVALIVKSLRAGACLTNRCALNSIKRMAAGGVTNGSVALKKEWLDKLLPQSNDFSELLFIRIIHTLKRSLFLRFEILLASRAACCIFASLCSTSFHRHMTHHS